MGRLLSAILLATALAAAQREIVVVDTDSGLFGDDGAAVVMLLRSPAQVTVPGITVVPGNVWAPQGAEYMLHILDLLKRPDVPVYMGAETPLANTVAMAHEEERRWGKLEYIGAFAHDANAIVPAVGAKLTGRKPHRDGAVQFLISEIERRPGEVTILAIGPMTNIALALRLKPAIETKIKQIVFMGGNIKAPGNASPWAEFNFWFDPEAARMVLRSRIPKKVMFALDVCNTAPIRKAEFDQIASAHTAHRRPLPRRPRQSLSGLPEPSRRHRLHVGLAGGGVPDRPRFRYQSRRVSTWMCSRPGTASTAPPSR